MKRQLDFRTQFALLEVWLSLLKTGYAEVHCEKNFQGRRQSRHAERYLVGKTAPPLLLPHLHCRRHNPNDPPHLLRLQHVYLPLLCQLYQRCRIAPNSGCACGWLCYQRGFHQLHRQRAKTRRLHRDPRQWRLRHNYCLMYHLRLLQHRRFLRRLLHHFCCH